MPIMRATRGRDASTAADRATAEDSGRSITAALRKLRDSARGDALRLALICGVTSWAIMLLVTVPAAIAVASFKMTTGAAIRALQVHDFLMNAPGPATAAVVERSGPRAAIALGLLIYVVVVGGLWACGSDDALYPVVTAGGRGERRRAAVPDAHGDSTQAVVVVSSACLGCRECSCGSRRLLRWMQPPVHKSNCRDASPPRLNHVLHAIDATPDRWRAPRGAQFDAPDSLVDLRTGRRPRGPRRLTAARSRRSARANEFCIYSASMAPFSCPWSRATATRTSFSSSAPFLVWPSPSPQVRPRRHQPRRRRDRAPLSVVCVWCV